MALGGLAVLASIVALGVLDRAVGHRTLRNWRSPIAWLSRYRPRCIGDVVAVGSRRGWPTPG